MQSLSLNVSDENSEDEAYTSPESSPQGGSDGEEVTAAVGEKDKAPSTHSRDSGKATSIYTSEPDDMYSKVIIINCILLTARAIYYIFHIALWLGQYLDIALWCS